MAQNVRKIDLGIPLDRRGLPATSICTKNHPWRPILMPFRGTQKLPADCLQVPRAFTQLRMPWGSLRAGRTLKALASAAATMRAAEVSCSAARLCKTVTAPLSLARRRCREGVIWVPEGSLAGVCGCHEMALELVSGADFWCKLMPGAGPVDLGRSRGRFLCLTPENRPDNF